MHFILRSLGINEVWTKDYLPSKNSLKEVAKKEARRIYLVRMHNNSSRKFNLLREEINEKYSIRSYVNRIQNPTHRSTISKLRTESHCLLSESHVYLDCSSNCQNCTMGTQETPYHFILECQNKQLALMRQSITKRLRITEHNKMEKFREIITGEIPVHEIIFVYKTIHEMYIKRQADDLNGD